MNKSPYLKTFEPAIATIPVLISISIANSFENGMLELPKAFAHWWFLFSLLAIFLATVQRLWLLALSSLVLSVTSVWLVLPQLGYIDTPKATQFIVGHYNFYHHNAKPHEALETVGETDPDVIAIQEFNAAFVEETDEILGPRYPVQVTEPWKDCCYGIALFSKFPILESEILSIGNTPVIRAIIDVNGTPVCIISLHTRPPAFPDETDTRNEQLMTVAEMARKETYPCIVLGDFNIVPWDSVFQEFLREGNLTAVHNGLQLTYPMDLGFPLIPIDHITYSGNLVPTSCDAVNIPGSDHRGLVAGFYLKD